MKAKIIIGANLGDEGKGTVVANYTKQSCDKVLNILTNGGAQRGHSILTEDGSFTFQHFGSGTYHSADSYFSQYFILNPMQFVKEYLELANKGIFAKNNTKVYRHPACRWSTPYDMMANQIIEEKRGDKKHGSCGMGIWETVLRYKCNLTLPFGAFVNLEHEQQVKHLRSIKQYFDKRIGGIPSEWAGIWNNDNIILHFINDCKTMYDLTTELITPEGYNEVIFENGQGLMLNDNGLDEAGKTPSKTDSTYALSIAKEMGISDDDITLHYVTRPYLTRHGRGHLEGEKSRSLLSSGVQECRTNHYNPFQEDFRYASLDIKALRDRINEDNSHGIRSIIELTHCDEMDRVSEFKGYFGSIKTYDSPIV